MKITKILLASLGAVALLAASLPNLTEAQTTNNSCQDPNYTKQLNPIYRQWNGDLIDHFYTNYANETAVRYVREQTTWGVVGTQAANTIPLYRYYSPALSDHFYSTSSTTPRDYMSEGMVGFIFPDTVPGAVPLYRLFRFIPGNPANGDHLYTTSTVERDAAGASGYQQEGIEGYVCPMS